MSRSDATPRRVKRSAAARLRPFWIVLALAALLAIGAGAFATMWPGFDPKRIEVVGNASVPRAEILQRAQIPTHESIWVQNTAAIAARIRSIPQIGDVAVLRVPPAALRIAVTERVPFAMIENGGRRVVVDRALRVLSFGDERVGLPVFTVSPAVALVPGSFVTTHDARGLREAYDRLNAAGLPVATLRFDRWGELVATSPRGLRLLLGEPGDLSRKVKLVNAILTQIAHGTRRIAAIDVRAPDAPVLVYR